MLFSARSILSPEVLVVIFTCVCTPQAVKRIVNSSAMFDFPFLILSDVIQEIMDLERNSGKWPMCLNTKKLPYTPVDLWRKLSSQLIDGDSCDLSFRVCQKSNTRSDSAEHAHRTSYLPILAEMSLVDPFVGFSVSILLHRPSCVFQYNLTLVYSHLSKS